MSNVKFGWSEVRLVPDGRKVDLAGQFYERITDVVRDHLYVNTLAIECGEDNAIFCACDLVSVSHILLEKVREILAEKYPNVPADSVVLSAIHTHTGPSYAHRSDASSVSGSALHILEKYMPEDVSYDKLVEDDSSEMFHEEEAFLYIAERIAESAASAWNKRCVGKYASAFGRAAVGMCRRVCYDDGSAKMWGDTNAANFTELEGGNDSGIELIFIADENEKLTGVVANLSCPSQVLEHRNFMSADFWGDVKKCLRARFGEELFLLPLCAAGGDQCPRDMIRWVEPETPINDPNIERIDPIEHRADPSMFDIKGCEVAARRIATEILFAYDDGLTYSDSSVLTHKKIRMDVPLRRVTIEEKDHALAEIERFFKEHKGNIDFRDTARMHIYAGTVARFAAQQTQDLYEIEIHVLRFGDIAIATNPYELFLDYGNQIRARSLAKQTFLIQLCCGSYGYLPTEKAEKGSHYSAYVSSGTTGHVGGDMLVRKTLSEINEMWK